MDTRAFATPKGLRPRRRVKPAYDGLLRGATPEPEGIRRSYGYDILSETAAMKTLATLFAVAALALASTSAASAKGCLKGAAVGGVAGHYAGHHGVLGAIAGCAYGRHRANEQARERPGTGRTAAPAGEKL
jgi:hypothetical protein